MNPTYRRKPSLFLRFTASFALFSFGATSLPRPSYAAEEAAEEVTTSGVITRGTLLHLVCTEDAKLNGDFRVTSRGTVNLPYDVSLKAAGVKIPAFQETLEKTYKPYFLGKPNIRVTIKQKRYWVKILGVVKSPGEYLIGERTTLGEALAMAGVRTEDLSAGFVRITRGTRSEWVSMEDYLKGTAERDSQPWTGGEQILFQLERPENDAQSDASSGEEPLGPSARKVQVIGEVRNPGGVSFRGKEDGYYYLIQRGGPTQFSDLDNVEQLRSDRKTGEKKRINIGSIQEIKDVKESDILLINPTRPSSFEHGLQNTALIATIISSIVLTIYVTKK